MTPQSQLARFDVDMALAKLRPAIRAAGFMVANGGTGYGEELDDLLSRALPNLFRLHPDFDSFEIEGEIADLLADAAAEHETVAYREQAVRRAPGLLYRGRAPARALTGLQPYYSAITEPRDVALTRQRDGIERMVREGARIGAAWRELAHRREAELPFLPDPTPGAKAVLTRRLHREVAGEFGFTGGRISIAPRMLVSGAQGTGKTAATLKALALVPYHLAVRFAVPLLEKAAEAMATYRAAAKPESLPAMLVRGRSAPDPNALDHGAMCPRHEAAEKVSQAGLSVRTTICATCPLREACGYLKQQAAIASMDGVGVFFMASAGLFLASPAPAADLLIVDERLAAEDVHRVPLDTLDASTLPYPGGEGLARYSAAHATMEAVRDALAHPDQLATMRGAGVTPDRLADAIALLRPLAEPQPLASGLTDKQIDAALSARDVPAAAGALRLLRAVAAEIGQPRPGLNGVALPDRKSRVATCRLRRPQGIAGAAVLALDGTGNPELVRHVFGARLEHVECRVERDERVKVTSPLGKGYSRQSITGVFKDGTPISSKAASAAKLQSNVAAITARLPKPCLLVADKAAEAALLDHLPLDTRTTHYGAVRGKNEWESCRSIITAGPAPIGLDDVENLARCYMANDTEAFVSWADAVWPGDHPYNDRRWPFWCTRMRRMRDGSLQPVEVAIHPDPRVQTMFEQIREAEVIQAVDRVRPVWHEREVVTLDSVVLDLTYDACPSHRDLVAGGTVWQRAIEALGILPLGARDLAAAGVFKSRKAAESALERAKFEPLEVPIKRTFGVRGYSNVAYRLLGQAGGRLSKAVIDTTRHPDPRSALELLLGPLAWFEVLPPAAPVPELPVATPTAAKPIMVPVPRPRRQPSAGRKPHNCNYRPLDMASSLPPVDFDDFDQDALMVFAPDPPPWLSSLPIAKITPS